MTADPYNTLGVSRDASTEDIRKAYRSKAKGAHPDAGGSQTAFEDIGKALAVLTDPTRRQHYDATGEADMDGPAVDNSEARALGYIADLLKKVICQSAVEPQYTNVVLTLVEIATADIAEGDKHLAEHAKVKARAAKMLGRFKRKAKRKAAKSGEPPAENLIERMLKREMQQIDRSIEVVKAKMAPAIRAKEILSDYEFDIEKLPPADLVDAWKAGGAGSGGFWRERDVG